MAIWSLFFFILVLALIGLWHLPLQGQLRLWKEWNRSKIYLDLQLGWWNARQKRWLFSWKWPKHQPKMWPSTPDNKIFSPQTKESFYRNKDYLKHFLHKYQEIQSYVQIKRIHWITEIGLDDPAITGFSVGLLWTVKGLIVNYLYHENFSSGIKDLESEIQIFPNYQGSGWRTNFLGFFKCNFGRVLIVFWHIYKFKRSKYSSSP